ncbi:MAG: gamma-glutamyl-gamma-aminobutyrate hydrolase family protein [Bdellovibrionales bacterium]|nr:gamma-glutamyl-gamma-aminobutyrate hydrolase family protein [Bdellovibrionales bacterium]
MTNQIAIVDPFVVGPSVNCFNSLVNLLGVKATYHMPGPYGIESLLAEASRSQAYIVLGSASHVHEDLPWHKPLADFLLQELQKNKPIFGCCFGHQIMCHVLGAKVEYHTEEQTKQMGVRKISITENFWNFNKGETFNLGVTHKQVVRNLPNELKAVGHGLENDIVIHKTLPFMGTQAHPEASNYFCLTDINNLNQPDIEALQKDGGAIIRRFFQHFKLI